MDYQFNVYPSTEKEMLNVKTDHKAKKIKVIKERKLKDVYKEKFGAAVTKFNEYALAGRLINDYYQAIVNSNVPEVYRLCIVVRYDLAQQNEVQLIQKSFTDFQKRMEAQPYFAPCSTYWMSVDEFQELNIFFVPVSDGYATQLGTRNDLIDVAKKMVDSKENWNILKAMPVFVEQVESIWSATCDPNIISHDEMEKKARIHHFDDPMQLHSIEVGMLKENINHLQRLTHANQELATQVDLEKQRIEDELDWVNKMGPAIIQAEQDRLDEIRRKEEEARRAEEERIAAEERAKEERRLAELARKQEAERLTQQAKKNYSLRAMLGESSDDNSPFAGFPTEDNSNPFGTMNGQAPVQNTTTPTNHSAQFDDSFTEWTGNIDYNVTPKATITAREFKEKLALHVSWMNKFQITQYMSSGNLTPEALQAPERLVLDGEIIVGFESTGSDLLVGAQLHNCTFYNCKLSGEFYACVFVDCKFINTTIHKAKFERCGIKGLECVESNTFDSTEMRGCTIIESKLNKSNISKLTLSFNGQYGNLDMSESIFSNCDIKRNKFYSCNFTNAIFDSCDVRATEFIDCKVDGISTNKSLFVGAKIPGIQ